jgi:hypothetical protein
MIFALTAPTVRGGGVLTRSCWLIVLSLLVGAIGCTSTNPDVRVRRLPDGHIQVDGPLAGPFDTLEQLAERACDIMTRQPGAANGPYGFEDKEWLP